MANKNAVWGIDIGQCALKALRCTLGDDGQSVVADKYDYIEYPKILSSNDADPEELVQDALKQFLSRNEVVGDKVAISVSGQAGLSRFFKPPPVEVKTLPDIVKFEVKQQIPFPIEDVIWDWQQLGGTVVDGRTVDAEVGLFAMKREAVFSALHPFDEVDVDVDLVQLSPLAIFNVVCHDIIGELPDPEDFDPENPPPSIVVMSMGTDTTDLIVTNGVKLWLRNIPIGGNHFTKQLSRELKLTQAKAEHLKRNARASENPKAIFKAMRPVFNDFVNEVQRSLTFFESMEKNAELSKIVLLGNAARLPGLRQYLAKQLDMGIAKVQEFQRLEGSDVTSQKTFSENVLSFAPSYGLCLQGLKQGAIKTNLLPREIVVERIIEAKKPWVLTAVSAAMLGLTVGWWMSAAAWHRTTPDYTDASGTDWSKAFREVDAKNQLSTTYLTKDQEQKETLDKLNRLSREITSASEQKSAWLDLQAALAQAFPKDPEIEAAKAEGGTRVDPAKVEFMGRGELYVDHIESVYLEDLAKFEEAIKPFYEQMCTDFEEAVKKTQESAPAQAAAGGGLMGGATGATSGGLTSATSTTAAPTDGGWVIEIKGHHFHNSDEQINALDAEKMYLMRTLIAALRAKDDIVLPSMPDKQLTFSDIGISYPTIVQASSAATPKTIKFDPTNTGGPTSGSSGGGRGPGGIGGAGMGAGGLGIGGRGGGLGAPGSGDSPADQDDPNSFEVREYQFVIQMAWRPRSEEEILEAYQERIESEQAAAQQAAAEAGEAGAEPAVE